MNTPTSDRPAMGYLVSRYPATSHTFILREVQMLRALGFTLHTASINPPDRPVHAFEAAEQQEARQTYGVKADGAAGALRALAWATLRHPRALWRTLRAARPFGLKGLAYAVEAAMIGRWMDGLGLRFLHVHFGNAGASVGVLAKAFTGCHLSITIHGPDEFDHVGTEALAHKMAVADEVVCISQFARSQLMRLSDPVHWPKLRLCRLGVVPSQFPYARRLPGPGPVRLLCTGRLTPAKGQVVLVQACARLRARGLVFTLLLLGEGPDRPRLEAAIAAHGLGEVVTLAGAVGQQRVRAELAQADVFVLPSFAEGIPVALMEAMSSGVPCVSTPVNGIPELIRHEQTGLLATPGDTDSLAEALGALITDPALRERLAIAGRRKVEHDFDLDRNVHALAAIFDGFLLAPPSSQG